MLAVGALVPLGDGRLGRAWRHKRELEELARYEYCGMGEKWTLTRDNRRLSEKTEDRTPLEEYWQQYRVQDESKEPSRGGSPAVSPTAPKSKRETNDTASPNGAADPHHRITSTASGLLLNPLVSHSSDHPALAIPAFLDTFGPLAFPLYRAALLRKRILFVGNAPVEQACNFSKSFPGWSISKSLFDRESYRLQLNFIAYILSLLSTLPSHTASYVPLEPLPARLQTLFSVGVHDMSLLSRGSRSSSQYKGHRQTEPLDPGFGWIACTTDDILTHKPEMWDLLITLPPENPRQKEGEGRVYPVLKDSKGKTVRATQRDLRRWTTLHRIRTQSINPARRPKSSSTAHTTSSPSPFTLASSKTLKTPPAKKSSRQSTASTNNLMNAVSDIEPSFEDPVANEPSLGDTPDEVVEPQSWAALAYTSFLWWASAGEKRTDLDEEAAHDAELMADLASAPGFLAMGNGANEVAVEDEDEDTHDDRQAEAASVTQGVEVDLIKYFHRLSSLMFSTLANIIESKDEQEEDVGDDGLPPSQERYRDDPAEGQEDVGEDAPLLAERSTTGDDASPIYIANEDLTTLGLDVYSPADKTFIREMIALYWGRDASVAPGRWTGSDGDGWELCGLRVC